MHKGLEPCDHLAPLDSISIEMHRLHVRLPVVVAAERPAAFRAREGGRLVRVLFALVARHVGGEPDGFTS